MPAQTGSIDVKANKLAATFSVGKSHIFYAYATDTPTALAVGDQWFVLEDITVDGSTVTTCTSLKRWDGTSWAATTVSDGVFTRINAGSILVGILRAITIQGPHPKTKWDLSDGEFSNHGTGTVTAQVETSEGVYTPVTYSIDHVTAIAQGLIQLLATIDSGAVEHALFSLGLAGEGITYDFYNSTSGDATSYPYARLKVSGPRITGKANNAWPTPTQAVQVTYIPSGVVTPDYIELGQAEDLREVSTGETSTKNPNRNVLHLGGGWVSPYKSIYIHEHYWDYGGSKRYKDVKRYVSWEYTAGDSIWIGTWYGCGILSDNKKSLRVTVPVNREFAEGVDAEISFLSVLRAWQPGTTIVDSETDTENIEVIYCGAAGITMNIKKDDESAWTSGGTLNAPVALELIDIQGQIVAIE